MLTVKMKDVNREANVLEFRVILHMFRKVAIIVEKNMIWHLSVDSKGSLDEFLVIQRDERVRKTIIKLILMLQQNQPPLTAHVPIASAP